MACTLCRLLEFFLAKCEEGRVCTKPRLCPKCLRYGVWMHCGDYLIVPFLRAPRINSRRYLMIESRLVGLVGHWQCHHKGLCMLTFRMKCPECWFLSCVQWLTKLYNICDSNNLCADLAKTALTFRKDNVGFHSLCVKWIVAQHVRKVARGKNCLGP